MTLIRRVRRSLAGVAIVAAVAAVALGACASPTASTPTVAVADAWIRPAAAGATTAAYLTITNSGSVPDTLVAVHCTIAGSAMLHQTSTDTSGMTGMSMLDKLPVPAGSTIKLEPGGTHVMIGGLTKGLAVGDSVELRLTFEHAGEIVVPAAVRAS